MKRVIGPADVQAPSGGIKQANKGYLEVLVSALGLENIPLIMTKGRYLFFKRQKS